ncbi:MAG: pilus assembly protein TadG-related protein [Eubacteriales bacterium]
MKLIKRVFKNEKGQTVMIAAVVLMLVIAVAGLVLDLGLSYIEASNLQNAADAAVYAGGSLLPIYEGDTDAIAELETKVESYIIKNGYAAEDISSIELGDVVSDRYTSLKVAVNDYVNYTFGKTIGMQGKSVEKSAKIRIETVTRCTDMVPLGTSATEYLAAAAANEAQSVVIKYDGGDGTIGFFGAIDLDGVKGGGAADFESWLTYGYNGYIEVGETLPVESGNMEGATVDGFTSRYEACTHFADDGGCTAEHYVLDCPRVVILILYEMEGTKAVSVVGFAPFILEGIDGDGDIIASHIDVSVYDFDSEELDEDTIEFGFFTPVMVE